MPIKSVEALKKLALSHWKETRPTMVKSMTREQLEEQAMEDAEWSHEAMQRIYDKLIKDYDLDDLLATSAAEQEILPMRILLPYEKDEKAGLI